MFKKTLSITLALLMTLSCFTGVFDVMAISTANGVKLSVNFNDESAQNQIDGGFSDGQITGDVKFVESFDGTKALAVENPFGEEAKQYVKFPGVTFGTESFTISFWYQATGCGGQSQWKTGAPAFNGFENYDYTFGGTVFSNTSTKNTNSVGLSVLNFPSPVHGVYAISDGNNSYVGSQGAGGNYTGALKNMHDSLWHKITISVDRSTKKAIFYVDGENTKTQDISNFSGSLDSSANALVFGADALGGYGAMFANFDNIEVYNYAIDAATVKTNFNYDNYKKLLVKVESELMNARVGDRFSQQNIETMNTSLVNAYEKLDKSGTDYVEEYNALYDVYLNFLNGKKPLGVAILTSDTHLRSGSAYYTNNLVKVLNYKNNIPYETSTLVNAGDYDENRIDYHDGIYFDVIDQYFAKGNNITHAVSVGNHQYTHPGNTGVAVPVSQTNYLVGSSKYLDATLEPNKNLVDENGVLKKTYYYTTDGAAHYIVLNPWEDASAALEGNFTTAQREWLKNTLDYCDKDGKAIFVVNHLSLSASVLSGITELLTQYKNVIYISGHAHFGLGSYGAIYKDGFNEIYMPSTFWERSDHGRMSGGAYYAYIYDDQVVLRAFDTNEGILVPEYDQTLYFDDTEYKLDIIETKQNYSPTSISGLNKATASYYGYTATARNTELNDFVLADIIENNTVASGKITACDIEYTLQPDGNYTYSLENSVYKVPGTVISETLQNGKMHSTLPVSVVNPETGNNTIEKESYFGGGFNWKGNQTLKAAIAAGKVTLENSPTAISLFEADAITEVEGLFFSLGNSGTGSTRKYDIYVSTSLTDLYESYNKVFSYAQQKDMVNTNSTQYYYNLETKEFSTDSSAGHAVTWGNAQYIEFTGDKKPQGKYIAMVMIDTYSNDIPRADIAEFKVFESSSKYAVAFKDNNGDIYHTEYVEKGTNLKDVLTVEEVKAKVPATQGLILGRTVKDTTLYFDTDFDLVVNDNTVIRTLYSECVSHNFNGDKVCDACNYICTCTDVTVEGKKDPTCIEPGYTGDKTCNVCGTFQKGTVIETAGEHKEITVGAVTATCANAGYTGNKICEKCNIFIEGGQVIEPTGDHSQVTIGMKDATCTTAGYTGIKACENCNEIIELGEVVEANGHKNDKVTTKEATLSTNGYKLVECSVCGKDYSKTTYYYPKTIKLSTTTYTYNGKAQKPSITVVGADGKTISSSNYTVSYASGRKNPGKYKVTIKFKGNYEGTKTLYFTIKPKKASLSSVKSTAKKKMTVKWSAQSGVTGYEVFYATNSKFTKGKKTVTVSGASSKSKKISSLKSKKTYYVKVRAYKTIDGKKVYGSYSSYKKVKVK